MRQQTQVLRNKRRAQQSPPRQVTVVKDGVLQHITPISKKQKPKEVVAPKPNQMEIRRKARVLQQRRELARKRQQLKLRQQQIAAAKTKQQAQKSSNKRVQQMSAPPAQTPAVPNTPRRANRVKKAGCGGCKRKKQGL